MCYGKNVEKTPINNSDRISRDYKNDNERRESINYYTPDTYLCLNCGYVMKILNNEALEKYKNDKDFFTDKIL
jgi:hypothetical protein